MRPGIQLDLNDSTIAASGCYVLCLIHWAEQNAQKWFSDEDVLKFIDRAMIERWVAEDLYVRDPVAVYNLARGRAEMTECKKIWDRKAIKAFPDFIVCNYKRRPDGTEDRHFTAFIHGKIFDPLPPDRPAAKLYTVESFRVLI